MENKNSKRVDLISLKVCKEKSIKYYGRTIGSPKNAFNIIKEFVGDADREYLGILCLNTKKEPCSVQICSIGTLDSALFHPREIFKSAICTNASSLIIFHTHPSGSIEPSKEDIAITEILKKVGDLMQIPVLDHIIVGDDEYFSFKENNIDGED